MNRERDYLEFQRYLDGKRQNVSPGLGHFATNLLIAPIGMGVVEASEPRSASLEYQIQNETPSMEPFYQNQLAEISVRQLVARPDHGAALKELAKKDLSLAA